MIEKMIINIFSVYVGPLLKYINDPALLQEWKVNLNAEAYEKILILTCLNLLKKKLIVMIATCIVQPE